MAYYGNQDKKSIVFLLDNGIANLKDKIKNNEEATSVLWKEYREIENILYNEGAQFLSMTNKVRFEKRLNTIRKMLEKLQ